MKISEKRKSVGDLKKDIRYQELRSTLISSRLKAMSIPIALMTLLYSMIIVVFFSLRGDSSLSNFLIFPFKISNNVANSEINILNTRITSLENFIKNSSASSDMNLIAVRVGLLEDNQKKLNETVGYDLDKALTAKLLREKQIVIEDKISQLEKGQEGINGRMDSIIIIPLVGFVLSLVSALVYFLFTKFKKTNT